MRWWLRSSVLVVIVAGVAGFYGYLHTLPTQPPAFVSSADLNARQPVLPLQCAAAQPLRAAYRVRVDVVSRLNDRDVYASAISFRTQLQQANADLIQAVATDVRIDEGAGVTTVADLAFLSRVQNGQGAVFVAFNALGLAPQHPLAVIGQLLKGLSVGNSTDTYRYSYDALPRLYRYRQTPAGAERAVFSLDTDLALLRDNFASHRSDWRIDSAGACLPQRLHSTERQALQIAGQQGYIEFRLQAEQITPYTDVQRYDFSNTANTAHHWQVRQINTVEFTATVNSEADMWAIFSDFGQDRNTARLVRAAEYLLDNISPDALVEALQGRNPHLADAGSRDLIFALGLSQHAAATDYMLDVLQVLPSGTDANVDMQKVRLMVALSGAPAVTPRAYEALDALARSAQESTNVQANALISMGSMVQQIARQGGDNSVQQQQLGKLLGERMQGPQAASAIMAANNAGVKTLDSAIIEHLHSSSSRERFAAGMTLSRDPHHYPLLIEHLQQESSNLVNQAILANMHSAQLTSAQRLQLQQLALQGQDGDKNKLIQQFLASPAP